MGLRCSVCGQDAGELGDGERRDNLPQGTSQPADAAGQPVGPRRVTTSALFGRTFAGRYLLVILAPRGSRTYQVVTARDQTSGERRNYRAQKG